MSGIILLIIVTLFLRVLWWLAEKITNLTPNLAWRLPIKISTFIILIILLFIDEIIGKHQFETLCKNNGIQSADVSKAIGKKVFANYSERTLLTGTIVPIRVSEDIFKDENNQEILIKSKDYYATGGLVMRYTPLGMGWKQPILFEGSTCGFSIKEQIFSKNNIIQIN